jgi:hypothetical protein
MHMDPRSSDNNHTPPEFLVDARFWQALAELLKGSHYAEMTSGNSWDYAVEIHVLRRFGLSDNDLRLLVQKRFVEHAREVTTERTHGRRFKSAPDLAFAKRTCFVLTALGIAKVHCRSWRAAEHKARRTRTNQRLTTLGVPKWDAIRRVLSYGDHIVKQFARPAANQGLVLSAFEEEDWPCRIDDPLAPHPTQDVKRRLCDTIKCLNQGQLQARLRFRGDGSGEGILWELVP